MDSATPSSGSVPAQRIDFKEGHTPAEIRLRSLVNSHQRIAFGACSCGKWDGHSVSFGEHILVEMKNKNLEVQLVGE